ncbi:MAG: hypothetical protein ABSG67_09130 [Thermoguttaceae bacterium]
MKANPGGKIDVNDILGRDELIKSIWQILSQQSIIITAERRIGKTCVIQKMQANPPPGWFAVYQDLEQIHSAEDFAQLIFDEVQKFLGKFHKAANRAKKFLEEWQVKVSGTEIQRRKDRHWKNLLICAIEDLVEQQTPNRLVFLWDEMPYMLDNLRRHEGPESAEELLDVLRTLRHTFPTFRMVLTGSVGLHHVIERLREAEYANEPINDMYPVDVPPLASEDAEELARRLIEGEALPCNKFPSAAALIANQADYVPFYIHHIVRYLRMSGQEAEPNQVVGAVNKQLVDPNDPWEFAHYRDRIAHYYRQNAELVLLILDAISFDAEPLSSDQIFEALKSQIAFNDRNLMLKMLRLMERDHYLIRATDGTYTFRFPLVERWWKLDRGL